MTTLVTYALGATVTMTAEFRVWNDETQTFDLTDPDSVLVSWHAPRHRTVRKAYGTGADVQRLGLGRYACDVQVTTPGEWWFRWEGSGAVATADEDSFYVRPSYVPTPVAP